MITEILVILVFHNLVKFAPTLVGSQGTNSNLPPPWCAYKVLIQNNAMFIVWYLSGFCCDDYRIDILWQLKLTLFWSYWQLKVILLYSRSLVRMPFCDVCPQVLWPNTRCILIQVVTFEIKVNGCPTYRSVKNDDICRLISINLSLEWEI